MAGSLAGVESQSGSGSPLRVLADEEIAGRRVISWEYRGTRSRSEYEVGVADSAVQRSLSEQSDALDPEADARELAGLEV